MAETPSSVDPNSEKKETPGKEETAAAPALPASKGSDDAADKLALEVASVTVDDDKPNAFRSATKWEELDLPEALLKAVYKKDYKNPSEIQGLSLPYTLKDPAIDFIGQGRTGSGKTACFTLTVLKRVQLSLHKPQAVILSNTRELARGIHDVVVDFGQFMDGLRVYLAIPDTPSQDVGSSHVVVGTPKTTFDALRVNLTRGRFKAADFRVLVLDEADALMTTAQGDTLGEQTREVVNTLRRGNNNLQLLMFSATFEDEHGTRTLDACKKLCRRGYGLVRITRDQLSLDNVHQFFVDCVDDEDKYKKLLSIFLVQASVSSVSQMVIFVNRREMVDALATRLRGDDFPVGIMRAGQDVSTADRDKTMQDFKDGKIKVVVATDVIHRGIDVETISFAVNFDMPTHDNAVNTYLHRIGRSGRFGRKGLGISFVHDTRSRNMVKTIEQFYKIAIHQCPLDADGFVDEDKLKAMLLQRTGMESTPVPRDFPRAAELCCPC